MAIEANTNGNSIKEVIIRILTEPEFKEDFINNPDEALKGYKLLETQLSLLKSLDRDDLDKLTPENLQELFSADSAVYAPDQGDAYEDFEELSEDEELR